MYQNIFYVQGAFLYVRYSFLLISNKFCDLSLLILGGGGGGWGQCGKIFTALCSLSVSPKAELWALEAHGHKTTNGPLIDTALYIMLLIRANLLLGQVGKGWALGNLDFVGPQMPLA
jgi:hypothetical protein